MAKAFVEKAPSVKSHLGDVGSDAVMLAAAAKDLTVDVALLPLNVAVNGAKKAKSVKFTRLSSAKDEIVGKVAWRRDVRKATRAYRRELLQQACKAE